MKKAKRLSAFVLAAVLTLSTAVQGFAADTVTTITGEVAAASAEDAADSSGEDTSVDTSGVDAGDAVTDPLLETYIEENADEEYTDTDEKKLVNYILVKQTFFDADLVEEDDTISSIMTLIEEGDEETAAGALDKYVMQTSGYVAVYELDEDSEYCVAYIDNSSSSETREAVFAVNNNDGETVDGCIYDADTGIAYIPKDLLLNDAGEQVLLYLQVQLMQLMDLGEDTKTVTVSVDDGNEFLSTSKQEVDFYDTETAVTLDAGLSITSVAVDGTPLAEDYYSYDTDSGELRIAQSPTSVQSVSVTVDTEGGGLLDRLLSAVDSAVTETAYALSSWDEMTYFARNIDIGSLSVNDVIDFNVLYRYDNLGGYQHTSTIYGAMDWSDNSILSELMTAIDKGTKYSIEHIAGLASYKQTNTAVWLNGGDLANYNAGLGSIASTMVLQCGHVDTSLGSTDNGSDGATITVGARIRYLATDTDSSGTTYAVFGIITQLTHAQSSVGIFKISIVTKGKAYVQKEPSDSTKVADNSNYSLANAVYGVYKTEADAAADKNRVTTLTTDSSGKTETVELDPTTYYVKEITASKGYELDKATHTVVVENGKTTPVYSTETYKTGDLVIYKYSENNKITDDNDSYELWNGATFGVYSNSSCSGTAVATVTLDQYDSANKRAYGTVSGLMYGTYWVKEISAPAGYYLNSLNNSPEQVTIGDTTAEIKLSFWDEPITITIELTKSADLDEAAIQEVKGTDYETTKANEFALHSSYGSGGEALAGAEYTVYRDMDGFYAAVETLTTDEDGKATTTATLPMGTYMVKETKAPEGYELDTTEHIVTADNTVITATNTVVDVESAEPIEYGSVTVYKASEDPTLMELYPDYYSLEGAEYTVYYDANFSRVAGVITIDETNSGTLDNVLLGDVWIKETKAPDCGYFNLDETEYQRTISEDTPDVVIYSKDGEIKRDLYVFKGPLAMLETGEDFTKDIPAKATSVVFTSGQTIPSSAIDVSYAQNGGIMAWLSGTTWYVQATEGGTIYFNFDSSFMFAESGFYGSTNSYSQHRITTIDFGDGIVDTSYAVNMSYMFRYCNCLTSIKGASGASGATVGLRVFDTSNVTNMRAMFFDCKNLTSIDLTTFDTSNVTDMAEMFAHCQNMSKLTLGLYFDSSQVTTFQGFAAYTNLPNATYQTIVDTLDISSATNLYEMFKQGVSENSGYDSDYTLTSLNLSGWNLASRTGITTMARMFCDCQNLTSLTGAIIPSSVSDTSGMFESCHKLGTTATTITLRSLQVTSYGDMFFECATDSGSTAGVTLAYVSDADDLAAEMVATKSSESNVVLAGTAVALADTSATMAASADTVFSRMKSALSGFSTGTAIGNGTILSSLAEQFSLVAEAAVDESELDFDDAVYTAFYDAGFTNPYGTFKFDHYNIDEKTGVATAVYILKDVPYGLRLYVKETSPASGYGLDEDTWVFSETAGDDDGNYVTSVDPQDTYEVWISMEKTLETDQNLTGTEYSMEGIKYIVYTDADCTEQLYWDKNGDGVAETAAVLELSANGISKETIGPIDIGEDTSVTYWIKEDADSLQGLWDEGKSTGIELDTEPHKLVATVKEGEDKVTTLHFEVTDEIKDGKLIVYKRSSDTTISHYVVEEDGYTYEYVDDGYSLAGAVFGLYKDPDCTELYALMTTTSYMAGGTVEMGRASLDDIPIGTYYLREEVAPEGFEPDLDENGDKRKYEVEITADTTGAVTKYVDDTPVTGTIEIEKISGNYDVTTGYDSDSYSLKGAVFGIYTSEEDAKNDVIDEDGKGTTGYDYLVTDEEGKASVSGLPLGTYYVKETMASKGFVVNSSTSTVTLTKASDSGSTDYSPTATVTIKETPRKGKLIIYKKSADVTLSHYEVDYGNGDDPEYYLNDGYSLAGAKFTLYTDEDLTDAYVTFETTDTFTDNEEMGYATLTDIPLGTYYLVETEPPEGFEADVDENGDPVSYKIEIVESSLSTTTVTKTVEDTPETGKLRVYKESAYRDLTDHLDTYSLEGAVYGVYTSKSDANSDVVGDDGTGTLGIDYLTTDASGITKYVEGLAYGTYYVKETKAPDGYEMDETVYTVEVTAEASDTNHAVELAVSDVPDYGGGLEIIKEALPAEGLSEIIFPDNTVEGAQFIVQYYDAQYASLEEIEEAKASPTRIWYINVISDGNGGYYASLSEECLQADISDDLYYDEDGNVIIPLGTVTVQESMSSTGYTLVGPWYDADGNEVLDGDGESAEVILFNVTQDSGTDSYSFKKMDQEDVPPCSVTLVKKDTAGNLLPGVTFTLYMYDEEQDDYISIAEATTDEEGKVVFEDLLYGYSYRIVETSTVDGVSLLAEPIDFDLPMAVDAEEVDSMDDVDMTTAYLSADGTYYNFCDITYTVTNSADFRLPEAGMPAALPAVLGIGVGIVALGLFLMFRRRKNSVTE
ncbi:MAG: BspA family leucine-rich repeat surface protein [Clostridiales bacterium]|nr:BspA family leucine-rich repeat surface protein [Clostridiales bacterium]